MKTLEPVRGSLICCLSNSQIFTRVVLDPATHQHLCFTCRISAIEAPNANTISLQHQSCFSLPSNVTRCHCCLNATAPPSSSSSSNHTQGISNICDATQHHTHSLANEVPRANRQPCCSPFTPACPTSTATGPASSTHAPHPLLLLLPAAGR